MPAPLEIDPREPLVKYEFIRMPDSSGFGDYTETGQVIPVSFRGRKGGHTHCMFLNDHPASAGGRELWGFPKKLASPCLRKEVDTLVGLLDYSPVRVAIRTMGYKHAPADLDPVKASLAMPNYLLKITPHVDCAPTVVRRGAPRPPPHDVALSPGEPRPLVPATVTACRHLSKISATVGRFGLVSSHPSHPISCPSWLAAAHHGGGCRAGSRYGTEYARGKGGTMI